MLAIFTGVRREHQALGGNGAVTDMGHSLVQRRHGGQQLLQQPGGAVVFKRNESPFRDGQQVRQPDTRHVVGRDDDLRGRFGEFADALQAWKRRVGKRRKLTRALTQSGFEPGHFAQRFMDEDQIEKLIPCACRLAALT